MKLEENQKYSFPVVGKKLLNGFLYYIIIVDDEECSVKAFESQRGSNLSQITCVFKGYNEKGEPNFTQDFALFIQQNYRVGEVYDFKVKTDNSQLGYYEVVDTNNIVMRLVEYGDNKVYVNQIVKARVKSVNLIKVELSLVTNGKREGIQFKSPLDLWRLYDLEELPVKYIDLLFSKSTMLKSARSEYEDGNALWIIQAVDAIDKNLAEWLNSEFPKHKLRTLKAYHRICMNLLEQSDYLLYCTKEERADYQKRISTAITHAEDYIVALNLMTDSRDNEYIYDHLERLKQSRYLFNPEKTMRVVMSLFTLREQTVQNYIQDIFAIIRNGHRDEQFMGQFRNAFVEMLDVFIWNESRQVNLIPKIYDKVSRQRVEEMVEALALQLLLLDRTEDEDKNLYRSMLYRYASVAMESAALSLIEKSFQALFNQEESPLEYTWEDLERVDKLCVKLSATTDALSGLESMSYHGSTVAIQLTPTDIVVTPLQYNLQNRKAYPESVTPWHRIRFLLNERLNTKVNASTTNLATLRSMWNELERSLFFVQATGDQPKKPSKKRRPSVGDMVTIRIVRQNMTNKSQFYCVIEDDEYEGEGTIEQREIVRYNVSVSVKEFCDDDTGRPFLLKATVKSIPANNKIVFTMLENMEYFIYQNAVKGDDVRARVTRVQDTHLLCVTEFGYALKINQTDATQKVNMGDIIKAQIQSAEMNGNVMATYSETLADDEDVILKDAFYTLLMNYADERLYEEKTEAPSEDELTQPENYVEKDYVEEVIHIIDRYAMTLGTNQVGTFNYLGVAKMLCRVIQDETSAAYYDKRMTLVKELVEFNDANRISDEKLNELLQDNEPFVSNYPEIKDKLTQLQIISHLDKKWADDFLWGLAKDQDSPKCSELAKLVLIHNMLEGFNVIEQQQAIRRRIYQTMDLNIRLPESSFVAHEDQFTELKTSMIYPAGKTIKPDEATQMTELLTVICSMLNSRGGTLYVGVNNMGYAVGLDNDFKYMSGKSGRYDIDDMRDKFDLKFRNNVHDRLGTMANALVESSFITVDGKTVYKVVVQPSRQIVKIDGKAYVRQGTSKWQVKDSDMETFTMERERMFATS